MKLAREGGAPGALTVCVFKEGSLLGQLIEVGGPGNRVTVAADCICLKVVGDDQENAPYRTEKRPVRKRAT